MHDTTRLKGVLAPVVTPFKTDLSPDPERFIAHCRWLLSHTKRQYSLLSELSMLRRLVSHRKRSWFSGSSMIHKCDTENASQDAQKGRPARPQPMKAPEA